MPRHWMSRGFSAALACCSALLSCTVVNSYTPPHRATAPVHSSAKQATTETLGGTERYLTAVSTDKPIYRGGEKVYVRGVLLNAANHKPLADAAGVNAVIEIKGPKGDTVASGDAFGASSVWGFAWNVPAEQAGGEYTIHVTYPFSGFSPAERKFDIRAYRAPRLKSQITFVRDGYGPGEKVNATLDVKRAEGGVPEGAKVSVVARVDGTEIHGDTQKVDANGLCHVSFDLPHNIPRGEGTLALIIEDGGVVETASKTIPIILQTVDLQMYPEGGDLIAGFPNRVYVQAKQPNGKPADLTAQLICKGSGVITEFKTLHEGRGRFEFTPAADKEYFLSVKEPAGIKTTYPLPQAKKEGAVVQSDKDVFRKGEPIAAHVGCTDKAFRVTLSKREVELAAAKIDDARQGALQQVSFNAPANADGVLTLTVWDQQGVPLAERLIFREPENQLKISITPDKKNYVPGDKTRLIVKTTDAQGKPVAAVVGLTVTDDSVLEMIEKREQAPRLPVMVYLEPEVQDLADAHVYMDANNPKAPLATDLLLGTQGWRRFALMNLPQFVQKYGDEARRAVALKIQSSVDMPRYTGMFAHLARAANGPVPPAVLDSFVVDARQPVPADGIEDLKVMRAPAMVPAAMPANRPVKDVDAEKTSEELQAAISEQAKKRRAVGFIGEPGYFAPMSAIVAVREFAHQVRKDRKPTDRVDFAETLYWNSGVKTDAKTGEATVNFGLNDSVSTFRVFADGFTGNGGIGAASIGIESVQPFYAEAKLPLEVTAGDRVLLPINLINATGSTLTSAGVNISLKGDAKLKDLIKSNPEIAAHGRVRWIQPINVGAASGLQDFSLNAKAGSYADTVTRKLSVKPQGFPIEVSFGGVLEPGSTVTHTITIPQGVVPGSMGSKTAVYPTPLANLTEALQRLIQDPCGCFEQTSSTSYPLTMAQQYFLSHTNVNPKLIEESRSKLERGYNMLVGFWCPDRGYEWFGENPGHEALTAYGLLHFTDMAKVRRVDQNMVNTTRAWLLKQKDGNGGFTRKRRALHTWIEDKDDSNAYIVWALLESGTKADELKPELASLKNAADASSNNYVVALAANAFELAGDKPEALKLMDRLASKQKTDGSEGDVKSSIVGSEGESLEVEGTSLAALAWLREPKYTGNVERSIKFLADSCKAGRYGSTQSTVLALRAIVNYDKQRAVPKAPGKVRVYVDGQSIGDWEAFNQHTQSSIKLPDFTELLTPGTHKVELRMDAGSAMPYSMALTYNALTPVSDKDCKVDLSVKMAQDKLVEGAATEANAIVTNKTDAAIPTPVAIIGLPGGMEPRHDQLKELVKKGIIDAYEVRGREVVLYWRALPAKAVVHVPLSLIAAVPGTYTGPASRAYLYYTDEHKRWVDGIKVEIAAR